MADPRTAYSDLADADAGPAVSRVERALLADLLTDLGPDQPTLCEGWTTYHLAAHLKIREGDPADQLRNLLGGDPALERAMHSTTYSELVARIRAGPPLLSPYRVARLEPVLNSLEFFVHHEDVRRAQPTWQRRTLPLWANDQLWRAVLGFCKLALRRVRVAVTLERADTSASIGVRPGAQPVVVRGMPAEVVLYLFGRRAVADVELSGPDASVDAFTRRNPRV